MDAISFIRTVIAIQKYSCIVLARNIEICTHIQSFITFKRKNIYKNLGKGPCHFIKINIIGSIVLYLLK